MINLQVDGYEKSKKWKKNSCKAPFGIFECWFHHASTINNNNIDIDKFIYNVNIIKLTAYAHTCQVSRFCHESHSFGNEITVSR